MILILASVQEVIVITTAATAATSTTANTIAMVLCFTAVCFTMLCFTVMPSDTASVHRDSSSGPAGALLACRHTPRQEHEPRGTGRPGELQVRGYSCLKTEDRGHGVVWCGVM